MANTTGVIADSANWSASALLSNSALVRTIATEMLLGPPPAPSTGQPLFLGSTQIDTMYVGSTPVLRAYLGSTLVFEA